MKKLIILPLVLLLASCDSPNTSNPAHIDESTSSLSITPGLEGCKLYTHKLYNNSISNHIYIVRCNSLDTTTTNYETRSGKTHKMNTIATVDDTIEVNGTQYKKVVE